MSLLLNSDNWVAIDLIDAADYSGIIGVAFDAVGLAVNYRINGGASQVKALTADDWAEGTAGAYSLRFTAAECATPGTLAFEVVYPGASTYYGAQEIRADVPAAVAPVLMSGTITNTGGAVIAGAFVVITTDILGKSQIGNAVSGQNGAFSYYLDPGNYYLFIQASGYTSLAAQPVTVAVDMVPLLYVMQSLPTAQIQAINYVKLNAQTATDPILTDAEIDDILADNRMVDVSGKLITDTGYETTYDLQAAVAQAWLIKAGKASGDYKFSDNGQSFDRQQVHAQCLTQYKEWRKGTAVSLRIDTDVTTHNLSPQDYLPDDPTEDPEGVIHLI